MVLHSNFVDIGFCNYWINDIWRSWRKIGGKTRRSAKRSRINQTVFRFKTLVGSLLLFSLALEWHALHWCLNTGGISIGRQRQRSQPSQNHPKIIRKKWTKRTWASFAARIQRMWRTHYYAQDSRKIPNQNSKLNIWIELMKFLLKQMK